MVSSNWVGYIVFNIMFVIYVGVNFETKTFLILLESFCLHSCFLLLFLGRLSSLKPGFLHCVVHLFLSMLSLWSPLSHQDAALAYLDSLPLTIWCSGQMALFLFLLAKAALAYLPTGLSMALRLLFPFQQAQYA